MVEENLMHKDASDIQTLEDLRTADASLRALARRLADDAGPSGPGGISAESKEILASIEKCRLLLAPAIGKLRGGMPKAPEHAKPKA